MKINTTGIKIEIHELFDVTNKQTYIFTTNKVVIGSCSFVVSLFQCIHIIMQATIVQIEQTDMLPGIVSQSVNRHSGFVAGFL